MGGPNGSQGAFWLILGLKTAIFEQFSKKFYIFLQICPKIGIFCPKMSQKAPRGPLGPPKMTKIVFLSCQDMKTPCWEKEFLSYLP